MSPHCLMPLMTLRQPLVLCLPLMTLCLPLVLCLCLPLVLCHPVVLRLLLVLWMFLGVLRGYPKKHLIQRCLLLKLSLIHI